MARVPGYRPRVEVMNRRRRPAGVRVIFDEESKKITVVLYEQNGSYSAALCKPDQYTAVPVKLRPRKKDSNLEAIE